MILCASLDNAILDEGRVVEGETPESSRFRGSNLPLGRGLEVSTASIANSNRSSSHPYALGVSLMTV
jgi:hypothetical protein